MKSNHIHKYERVRLGRGGYKVFKCMLPGCPHYIRKELVVARESLCWRCNEPMILSVRDVEYKRPHHKGCTRKKTIISSALEI